MKKLKTFLFDFYIIGLVVVLAYAALGVWVCYKLSNTSTPVEKKYDYIVVNGNTMTEEEFEKEPEGQGIGDLIEPPKPFIVNHPPKTPFPAHWGPAPKDLGNGGTYLPAPYGGWGSYELVIWILENQNYDLYKSK